MSGEGMRYGAKQIEAMSTEELLAAYKETSQQELKWPLVLRYQELVKRIALQIRGIYSSFAQLDDVINEGILTLLDAVDKYDPDKGIKFETYVTKRIRGMVIDLARRQDWTPRSVRRKAREIDQATWELYSALDQETQDLLDIEGLPCVEGPDMGVVWDKPHKDDIALISNSDATARSVTRPRSPVWNNYLRLAKIIQDEMVKDGVISK